MTRQPLGRARSTLVVACCAAGAAALLAQSAFSRVGLTEGDARETFMAAVLGMGGPGAAAKPFLALTPAMRVTVVSEVVTWAKSYVASPTFKKSWADKRDQHKPAAPAPVTMSVDDELKQQDAAQQQKVEDTRKMIASMPAEQRPALEAMVTQMTAQMAASAKDPGMQAIRRQAIVASRADAEKRAADAMTKWQNDYPADPTVVVARRLHDFLTVSASVNFDAKLVTRDGRRYFDDPQYEHENERWKACFRAGREANAAARAAAEAWLKELGK